MYVELVLIILIFIDVLMRLGQVMTQLDLRERCVTLSR
jgi:hypothetical protein